MCNGCVCVCVRAFVLLFVYVVNVLSWCVLCVAVLVGKYSLIIAFLYLCLYVYVYVYVLAYRWFSSIFLFFFQDLNRFCPPTTSNPLPLLSSHLSLSTLLTASKA
jgi:hypothetical protein